MKLVSLTITRNSAWSIEAVVGHALQYCDAAVVLNHASTDDTMKILRGMGDRVSILSDTDPRWDEMFHRQATLEHGRKIGGTHFLILDDDEFLTQNEVQEIRGRISYLKPGQLLTQHMRCCWRSLDRYRDDDGSPFSRVWKSVAFRDAPKLHWHDHQGYQHHHTHPYGCDQLKWPSGDGGWLHIQHANWKRLVAKQTWYMAMELCRWGTVRANYRGTMDERGLRLADVPPYWWNAIDRGKLRLDDEPWQVGDLRCMIEERGAKFFSDAGIDIQRVLNDWSDNV